jgi:hypothetical protein
MGRNGDDYPTEVDIRTALLRRAERFCALTERSRSDLGKRAVNDSHFLYRIENGEGFTVRTYQRVMDYITRETRRLTKQGRAA